MVHGPENQAGIKTSQLNRHLFEQQGLDGGFEKNGTFLHLGKFPVQFVNLLKFLLRDLYSVIAHSSLLTECSCGGASSSLIEPALRYCPQAYSRSSRLKFESDRRSSSDA